MAREPSYPDNAPVGGAAAGGASEAAEVAAAAKAAAPSRTKHIVAGAAIGIGSAALVAALLYANRSKKHDKGNG